MATNAKIAQLAVEAGSQDAAPLAEGAQLVVEAGSNQPVAGRVAQLVVEGLSNFAAVAGRVAQLVIESLTGSSDFTDDFNRADQASILPPWIVNAGTTFTTVMKLASATVSAATAAHAVMHYEIVFEPDQYTEAVVGGVDGSSVHYLTTRMTASGETFYAAKLEAGSQVSLTRYVAGVSEELLAATGAAYVDGDTLELEVSGSSTVVLQLYKNNAAVAAITASDASGSRLTAGYAGVGSGATTSTWGVWNGGKKKKRDVVRGPFPCFRPDLPTG